MDDFEVEVEGGRCLVDVDLAAITILANLGKPSTKAYYMDIESSPLPRLIIRLMCYGLYRHRSNFQCRSDIWCHGRHE
jgi:hypothetical protein